MNRRFRQPVTLGLSIVFICTALYCYWGRLGYMHELTFLSNFSVGIFLFDTVSADFQEGKFHRSCISIV